MPTPPRADEKKRLASEKADSRQLDRDAVRHSSTLTNFCPKYASKGIARRVTTSLRTPPSVRTIMIRDT